MVSAGTPYLKDLNQSTTEPKQYHSSLLQCVFSQICRLVGIYAHAVRVPSFKGTISPQLIEVFYTESGRVRDMYVSSPETDQRFDRV